MLLGAFQFAIERAAAAQHIVEDVGRDAARGEAGNLAWGPAAGRRGTSAGATRRAAGVMRSVQVPEKPARSCRTGPRITSDIVTKQKRDGFALTCHSAPRSAALTTPWAARALRCRRARRCGARITAAHLRGELLECGDAILCRR